MNVEDIEGFYEAVQSFLDCDFDTWADAGRNMKKFRDKDVVRHLLSAIFRVHEHADFIGNQVDTPTYNHQMAIYEQYIKANRVKFTSSDFFINANDCVYYFPNYDWTWLERSLVCVTALHHRPIPGAYKLPFGEGFYYVLPKPGEHGSSIYGENLAPYEVTQVSRGQGTRYTHSLIQIVDPETIISMGYLDIAQQTCTAMDLKVKEIRSPFPATITEAELEEFWTVASSDEVLSNFVTKPNETLFLGFRLPFERDELGFELNVNYVRTSPQRDHLKKLTGDDFVKNFAAPGDFFGQWRSYDRLSVISLPEPILKALLSISARRNPR